MRYQPEAGSYRAQLLDLLKGRNLTTKEAVQLTGMELRTCSSIMCYLVAHGLAKVVRYVRAEGARGRGAWVYSITAKGRNTPCNPTTTATSRSATGSAPPPATS